MKDTLIKILKHSKVTKLMAISVFSYFVWLMLKITFQYFSLKSDEAFLLTKQDYIHLTFYRYSFFIHVFTAILVLPAGFTQFSASIRINQPQLHRWMGWLYVIITLFLAAPSGFIIGVYANGGITSRLAFILLSTLWFCFTALALKTAIHRKFEDHKKWMIRSFSLALSAITLRAWKYVIVLLFHPKPMEVYRLVAWLGWGLNLIIAEIIIYKTIQNENKKHLQYP